MVEESAQTHGADGGGASAAGEALTKATPAAVRGLAKPTADLQRAYADLAEKGYCVITDVLDAKKLTALRNRLDEQAAGERRLGLDFRDGGPDRPNQRLWMLLNKGRVFRDLMLEPIIASLMGRLLGPDFLLSSLTANVAHRGGQPMALHTDQNYVGFWTPEPLVANIAWMLDDFSDENGATRLVPGSHLEARARPPSHDETVAAEGPAGAVLCFDGRLWHGTGANRTERPRRALLSYHCRPFVRQQENFTLGLDHRLWSQERPELLDRLGFKTWAGLGRVESPTPAVPLSLDARPIGPLNAAGELQSLDL